MIKTILVGGGTAGCLLAYRLSQHFDVLVLEAGGPSPSISAVPAFRPIRQPDVNYVYKSLKQRNLFNRVRHNN